MNKINVKIQDIYDELEKFNSAIIKFKPYTENFIRSTMNKFEGFNSDFIKKMEATMENMTDTNAPKALEKAQSLHAAAKEVAECFVSVDEKISTSITSE